MAYNVLPERDGRAIPVVPVDASGNPGSVSRASGSAITSVPASTSSVSLLPANPNRKGLIVANSSGDSPLFLRYGGTASATDFSVRVPPNGGHEIVAGYTGALSGVWTLATGAALVTELT